MQYSRHNYGALLQAAALEQIVRDMLPSAEVEHIDARPIGMKKSLGWTACKQLFKRYIGGLIGRVPGIPQVGNYEVFSNFRNQSLQLTEKAYFDYEDFEGEKWDYDLVIVGSDQVFRIKFVKSRARIFFLRFLPDSCKRIAYAASFGVDYWEAEDDSEFTEKINQDLSKFNAISVRESSGVDICRNTFGLDAKHVLDPTLLIGREYFDKIIELADVRVSAADWSVHCISDDVPMVREIPDLAKQYKKQLSSIYYSITRCWPMPARIQFNSVPEWLAQIRDTKELVLTDSFHCVCISILFEKNFLVFSSEEKGPGRMKSLLGSLGLEDRICTTQEALEHNALGLNSIDYTSVRENLFYARELSRGFLRDALHSSN